MGIVIVHEMEQLVEKDHCPRQDFLQCYLRELREVGADCIVQRVELVRSIEDDGADCDGGDFFVECEESALCVHVLFGAVVSVAVRWRITEIRMTEAFLLIVLMKVRSIVRIHQPCKIQSLYVFG